MSDRQGGRRGRPRDSAVDSRVLDAAWDLLHAKGFAGLTVDEVAERAGTAKTTVYRRWPTKDHLAVALADSLDRLRLAGNPAGGPSAGLAAELAAAAARHPDIGELVRAGFA